MSSLRLHLASTVLVLAACTPAAPPPDRDQTAPDTTLRSAPPALVASHSASFTFLASEGGATFACRLDAAAFAPCFSPVALEGIADGAHTFEVRAIDAAGNVDPTPAHHDWTVDTTAPETRIESADTQRDEATFTLSANEPGTFACSLDATEFAPCTSPHALTGLSDGAHVLRVRATDIIGNTDPTPAEHAWSVDLTPPETQLTEAFAPADRSNARFTFTSEEGATFECSLDAAAFFGCTSPHELQGLADGAHTFAVRATDAEGNVDPTPASHAWAIDTSPADTQLTSAPAATVATRSATFEFRASKEGSTFECSLDAAAFASCASPVVLSNLAEGRHTFAVRTRNVEGKVDPTPAQHAWTIDLTAPVTTLGGTLPPASARTGDARFDFTANEQGASFECSLDGAAFATCVSPAIYAGLAGGTHQFQVRATDAVGNRESPPVSHVWTVVPNGKVRIVAANLTSGNSQSYDPGHGARILQGLHPDVVLLQEFNFGDNSPSAIRSWVDSTFGLGFQYFREAGASIPNGIVSRFPIVASGEWDDITTTTRDFAWARIDVPGPRDLWAVSVHLLTANSTTRQGQAQKLVEFVQANVPADDLLVIGGDFNTNSRAEDCFGVFAQVAPLAAPYPVDQQNNGNTNAGRSKPYDQLLADADLQQFMTPVVIGASSFPGGLVFDSRVFTPLADVAPVLWDDSAAINMQHMAVVRDFALPLNN